MSSMAYFRFSFSAVRHCLSAVHRFAVQWLRWSLAMAAFAAAAHRPLLLTAAGHIAHATKWRPFALRIVPHSPAKRNA